MVSTTSFLALSLASLASAHVSCNPPTAPANGYFATTIRVPHSYPGAITTNVSVQIPDKVTSVKPQLVGGWKVELGYSDATNKTLSTVTWYGGELPDALYADFGLQMKLPNASVGTFFYFPTTQMTSNGSLAWTSVPDANGNLSDPAHPAPKVTIVAATTASAAVTPAPAATKSNSATLTAAASSLVLASAVASIWS
ncbi:hypothetical protein SPRG_05379 [Saprolegnia parasitica CBS 223.65]|uniref:YncI copper-binding domain-containing protein n=1 Tax=Saprolegnia parasitica (strain CBS 223.65) TaxID=695850 RepID=A0A067CRJ2_SAPPC|nr:hypothetical protein SPRG_05379 [Saprolegnia parasitica CBS 223.65]KDO29136.1 hypothetical protein SPRG_05379 [Saprolegnia parasitica CBS 223.65]|eukprot:XP_012200016.1 hypothetical protein SPRG_05379 [Saprolegnia parasitica CBS 223.65]